MKQGVRITQAELNKLKERFKVSGGVVGEKAVVVVKIEPTGLSFIKGVLDKRGIKYVTEHQFVKTRKFRFDIAVLNFRLGVEYEGIFTTGKSRHTNIMGYTKDCTKYNISALEGWTLLRYTAKNYKDFENDIVQFLMSI